MFFSLLWIGSIVATLVIADQKKLNVVGYFLLSLIFGPLAFFIVSVVPPDKTKISRDIRHFTLQDAKQQLGDIKDDIFLLNSRVKVLEGRIGAMEGGAGAQLEQQRPVFVQPQNIEKRGAADGPNEEGLELVLGKYWLNRIGVVLFVIGIGLFISYTFQHLNAVAKIAIGYGFSIAFFFWGNFLGKKEQYAKIGWGILGGAWGLLYLSTYAMHYIPATRVIVYPAVEIFLLTAVSASAVYYNLKYQSWIITAMTFVLAFITAGLGGMSYSSIFYFSLLTGSLAYLSYKLSWYPFLLFGIVGSYCSHFLGAHPDILNSLLYVQRVGGTIYQFQVVFSILIVTWIIFSWVLFLLEDNDEQKLRHVIAGQLCNAVFFVFLGLGEVARVQSAWDIRWDGNFWFLFLLGMVYFLLAYISRQIHKPKQIVVNAMIGLTLMAMAIFIKAPELGVGFYWILEMVVLFMLGIYYKEWIYRVSAGVLSVCVLIRLFFVDYSSGTAYFLLGLNVEHRILIFSFAAACFFLMGAVVKIKDVAARLTEDELKMYYTAFPIFGSMLLTFLSADEVPAKWLSLSWTLLGGGILGVGLLSGNRVFRLCAMGILGLACLRLVFIDLSGVNTVYKIIAFMFLGGALLGVSMIYSRFQVKSK